MVELGIHSRRKLIGFIVMCVAVGSVVAFVASEFLTAGSSPNGSLPASSDSLTGSSNNLTMGPVKAEVTYYPFKLEMELENDTFKVGEIVRINFKLTNIGNETVTITFRSALLFDDFAVYNQYGEKIYEFGLNHCFAAALVPKTLKPSEFLERTRSWEQLKSVWPTLNRTAVEPGIYYIVGMTNLFDFQDERGLKMETPAIKISIVDTNDS